jgi:hypothetical protein
VKGKKEERRTIVIAALTTRTSVRGCSADIILFISEIANWGREKNERMKE